MLQRILDKLEDPKRPLLGPNVRALKFWGLLLPRNVFKRSFFIILHLLGTAFTASEFVNIYFIKSDIQMLLDNVKISILSLMIVSKRITFLIWHKHWEDVIEYVTRADSEQRNSKDEYKKATVSNYTKYSRKLTYYYCFLIFNTATLIVFPPLFSYICLPTYRANAKNGTVNFVPVLSSWVPFDKNVLSGYIITSVIQTLATIFGTGVFSSYDTTAIVIMTFLKGEIKMLERDSSMIFGTEEEPIDKEDAEDRIKNCQRRHDELLKYVRVFDSCLSPIMLLYMVVCSAMLCVTAYQITIETSFMRKFSVSMYLIFGIAQLFMYCWHSNDILYTSGSLIRGPYKSMWWKSEPKLQKDLYMLTDQFKTQIVLSVGSFTVLSVPTFVGIIKGAYSYYTLLGKSQAK